MASEQADHPISLGCTCMPPSLHSHLQSSGYYYYLHRCFLIAFYLPLHRVVWRNMSIKLLPTLLRSTASIGMPSRNQQINDGQCEQLFWAGYCVEIKEEPFRVISLLCSKSMTLWSIVIILVLPHYFHSLIHLLCLIENETVNLRLEQECPLASTYCGLAQMKNSST